MKIFNVPVSIFRLARIHHCESCRCRQAKELIAVQFVSVAAKAPEDAAKAAKSHITMKWYEEQKKDWNGIDFEAGEPVVSMAEVLQA